MRIVAIVIAMLAATATAHAAEINAFISTAIKAATDELLPPFERANGHTLRASYAPSGALIPRYDPGEPVDVFLTDSAGSARRKAHSSREWYVRSHARTAAAVRPSPP